MDKTSKILKLILFFLLLLSLKTRAQTPHFVWARQGGGDQIDHCEEVAVDAQDNYYITGYYNGTATFGSHTLTSAGGDRDIFIVKYNSNGQVMWAATAGGPGSDAGFGIAVDNSGNVYITGYFEQTAHFGVISVEAQDENDAFIAKYDASGNPQWINAIFGPAQQVGRGITVDNSGNIYTVGVFDEYAWFYTTKRYALGGDDLYLAKYSSNGELQWVKTEGSTGRDWAWSVEARPTGGVCMAGFFSNSAYFGEGSHAVTLTSQGDRDGFVSCYTSAGDLSWIRTMGSPGKDICWDVHVDPNGACFTTGIFSETADFGQSIFSLGNTTQLTSQGLEDVFVAKYNSTGGLYWAKSGGGEQNDSGNGVVADGSGGCFTTGYYREEASFSSQSLSTQALDDMYIIHYGSSGGINWLLHPSGTGKRYAWDITTDSQSDLLISGAFSGAVQMGNTALNSFSGSSDCVLTKTSTRQIVDVFDFEYGTLQEWTWDGIYDQADNGPWPNLGWDFYLQWMEHGQDGMLNWGSNGFSPSGLSEFSGDEWWYADLLSPDLSGLSSWQAANGFSFDLSSNTNTFYYSSCVKLYNATTGQSEWFRSDTRTIVPNSGADPHIEWIWEGEDNIPSDYSVLQVAVRIWGKVSDTFEADVFLDDVTPVQGEIPSQFDAPETVTALSGYHQAVPLAWTEPSEEVTAYKLYRCSQQGGSYNVIASNLSTRYYRDEAINNGQTYYYKVKAVYNGGESDFSSMTSATPVENGYRLFSGWASVPPTIDGTMNSGEWDGAGFVITTLSGINRSVTMYALNTADKLFIAINDQYDLNLNNGDELGVFFDENLDRLWPATSNGEEGLVNLAYTNGSTVRYSGFSGIWPAVSGQDWETPVGITGAISTTQGHVQYELSFDLTTSPLNPSVQSEIGWSIYVFEGSSNGFTGLWPQAIKTKLTAVASDYIWAHGPFSYGDLVLSNELSSQGEWADIDGDGDVDAIDIQLVAACWNTKVGDAGYKAECDIDNDGDVDAIDIQLVAGWWNKDISGNL